LFTGKLLQRDVPFAMKLTIIRVNNRSSDEPEVLASIVLSKDKRGRAYYNQLKLMWDAAGWVHSKQLELTNLGEDLRSFRLIVSDVAGYKRPQWLFDRLKKTIGVTVL
jgi:hypothetical protein